MKGQLDVSTPKEYIAALDEPRKSEIQRLHEFIRETVPEFEPHIRSGMIGYGTYSYKRKSGQGGEWFKVGLASNKNYISVYACAVVDGENIAEIHKAQLAKANVGKSCIRFKKFEDIDFDALKEVLRGCATANWDQ